MFRVFIIICLFFALTLSANATVKEGGIEKREIMNYNQIIDANTGEGIPQAKVTVPALKFVTITDDEGKFNLNAKLRGPAILSVQKDGYKPFSLTIDETGRKPLIIGIEKSSLKDIIVESSLIHLGDDSYSENSANAADFTTKSVGANYTKDFNIPTLQTGQNVILMIGSIIGIDTMTARSIGQSHVRTAYASPPEIWCNGNKICELNINGDNQQIKIPSGIIKQNRQNSITIRAGKNLMQTEYIDYDDIEFTNLSIEIQ